ncbi:DNA adenine methylase [Echinicola vietnamensis]|uniref:Site-specific DNA-methyltransferase (adenine-specific) n=1 Tax=Echinicola vietnamensis (strain DSM 17526 / LMG 23754 / KMM 6221) TaxID=926556 RepID=L0FY46_ECHVK|nr:Dam family site-specific DNA-(adenine-N6)-methyltransferase [Echinicola vietnamensis]AGA77676.1 DNA adenine methylase Dam [Echinicola vietnamensis DSM 17526]
MESISTLLTNDTTAKPFLRWAGGKTWLLKYLDAFLPKKFNNYHEPFIGGGSVFIYLKSTGKIKGNAYLSDKNEDLINAYNILKDQPEELIKILGEYKNEKDFYYFIRDQKFTDQLRQAGQFIFLNRTSFNGIYRVNLKGEYNVPYGFKKYKQLFDFENLRSLSRLLSNTSMRFRDFAETINEIKKEDLVFLDPPYTVAHGNNGFVKYNQKIFSWQDQERLKEFLEEIVKKEAYFILTNAAHESISNLFNDVTKPHEINRYSVVGGVGAERREISEYIFTNCDL